MKNKKTTYALMTLVFLVWGLVIYRVISARDPGQRSASISKFESTEPDSLMGEDYTLLSNYRDPFQIEKSRPLHPNEGKAKSIPKEKKTVPTASTKTWPQVFFDGTIKNQKSTKTLAMLRVDGQSSLASAGDEFNQIRVLRIFKDSIEVAYGKEKKFIRK